MYVMGVNHSEYKPTDLVVPGKGSLDPFGRLGWLRGWVERNR